MNITKDDISGEGVEVKFAGLVNSNPRPTNPAEKAAIEIKENGALTITSDYARTLVDDDDDDSTPKVEKGNKITWGSDSAKKPFMVSAKNTELNFTKVWFSNLAAIEHAGNVNSTNSYLDCPVSATGEGDHTSGI